MKTYIIERLVDQPIDKVWEMFGDDEAYHIFAPNIGHIELLGGKYESRRCYNETKSVYWDEKCINYIPGKSYSMKVDPRSMRDVEGKQKSYPLKSMQGTWSVDERGSGTAMIMKFEYEMKGGIFGNLMHFVLRVPRTFDTICIKIMDEYEKKLNDSSKIAATN